MADGGSIIKFEELGKPATVLIEKISAAIEGIYRPTQIKRIARAQAEADKIKAKAQIDIHNLQQRALIRFVAEEAKKQENMENITEKALPLLDKEADPQKMENDWITNFFDKCRIVSDEEMQTLWARILAGEANSPGAFSKRTVNFLSSLDKTDAQLFNKLCGFVWKIGLTCPLIFNEKDPIYIQQGITFGVLTHLDNIGLINFDNLAGFKQTHLPKNFFTYYFDLPMILNLKNEKDNEMPVGKVIFSKTGEQLLPICGSKPVDGFYDYIHNRWSKEGIVLTPPLQK